VRELAATSLKITDYMPCAKASCVSGITNVWPIQRWSLSWVLCKLRARLTVRGFLALVRSQAGLETCQCELICGWQAGHSVRSSSVRAGLAKQANHTAASENTNVIPAASRLICEQSTTAADRAAANPNEPVLYMQLLL
jgi:hypothetical protein